MKGIQMKLPLAGVIDEKDKFFELYVKNGKREFVRHVRFFTADTLEEAEDQALEADPEYWKTMKVRSVDIEYVWNVFQNLHFSYEICKSVLGLVDYD
tara:strand:- start:201 stop:491 length:291 start_codon:yes stop_codon:yes gene_type:complete